MANDTNSRRSLATGIANRDHLAVFEQMINARIEAIDVSKVMVYIVDRVDASALYSLAKQFDLLGYRGWKLATNEQERRDLIKRAIELHRFKGTPWSIKEAFKSVGFFDAEIVEFDNLRYDDTAKYDGEYLHGESLWALFSVILNLGETKGVTNDLRLDHKALIEEYKNVRSQLVNLRYATSLFDEVVSDEAAEYEMEHELSDLVAPYTYNAAILHDGEELYGGGADKFEIEIINL
jgi:P2-related tail formation protein